MKERLLAYLKNNRKKIIAFLIAGILAAAGVVADSTVIENSIGMILGF